jgi:hypothetical protein
VAGKGSHRRPSFISDEEYSLRWDLAYGYITSAEFQRRMADLKRRQPADKKGRK